MENPVPSTSGTQVLKSEGDTQPVEVVDDETLALRSLDIISKVAVMLKSGTSGLFAILEKVLALVDGDGPDKRKLVYDLVENVISNILEADVDELNAAKQHFENVFLQSQFKDVIDEKNLIRHKPFYLNDFITVIGGELILPDGTRRPVAIKKAKSPEFKMVIDQEASALSELKHKHIIKYFGRHKEEPEIVTELMDVGYLLAAAELVQFTTENLLRFIGDVACGMEYILNKKYLHRDLSSSTVFLNRKKQLKIGDFGFAVYVGDSNGMYEEKVRECDKYNMSPEVFRSKVFTAANEVWAMGILIWELFYAMDHLGQMPYSLQTRQEHVGKCVLLRVQLPKPSLCPEKLHNYVVNCLLNEDPKQRPDFTAIRAKLKEISR